MRDIGCKGWAMAGTPLHGGVSKRLPQAAGRMGAWRGRTARELPRRGELGGSSPCKGGCRAVEGAAALGVCSLLAAPTRCASTMGCKTHAIVFLVNLAGNRI